MPRISRLLFTSLALGILTLCAAPSIKADPAIFYNGNFDGRNAPPSERNTSVSDARTYDNFIVPTGQTWNITEVFGEFLASANWSTAHWEIRTGVSAGNGGTLLFSGDNLATRVATGRSVFGYTEFRATVTVAPFSLGAGQYWITIAPIDTGQGRAFVASTSGLNGINPLIDGNSFFDSTSFGANFEPTTTRLGSGLWDFPYGVNGTVGDAPVPEPTTMLLLGTGLVGIAARVRRRKAK